MQKSKLLELVLSLVIFSLWVIRTSLPLAAQQPGLQSDLAAMIGLLDQDKYASLAEAKQLRENNRQNRQVASLFDFSYALTCVKYGRWQDAIDVLQPFVDARPQVFQARMLLIRAYVELEKFDHVTIEAEKLLDKLPSDEKSLEQVVQTVGTLVGYLNHARKDCPDELKQRLGANAVKKIPDPQQMIYQNSISLAESRAAAIKEEIDRTIEQAEESSESKIASTLEEAERLRAEAEAKEAELKEREKERAESFEQVKLNLTKMELEYGKLQARQGLLDNQINLMRRSQLQLERRVTREDANGNRVTTTEIADEVQYNRLNRMIGISMAEMQTLEVNARGMMNAYVQLQAQAKGLADQKQLDELFTKSKMNQLSNTAQTKQKRAEREADRKGKKGPNAARGLNAKLKNYTNYDAFDLASNKEFLQEISKKFLQK